LPQCITPNLLVKFTVSVSIFGLFSTLMLALFPPTIQDNFLWRKPLIGAAFTLICISGIAAVFFPKKCSKTSGSIRTEKPTTFNLKGHNIQKMSITVKGHHPNCGRYSAHVICVNKHVFCAACTGLLLGALIAIAGTTLYFFIGWDIVQDGFLAVLFGQFGIVLGFMQLKFERYTRSALNALFVFAAFLILVGIDKLIESTFADLYLIGLIVFWLWTRILISRWDHWRICHTCETPCRLKERQYDHYTEGYTHD